MFTAKHRIGLEGGDDRSQQVDILGPQGIAIAVEVRPRTHATTAPRRR
jgi:hypothetical protein